MWREGRKERREERLGRREGDRVGEEDKEHDKKEGWRGRVRRVGKEVGGQGAVGVLGQGRSLLGHRSAQWKGHNGEEDEPRLAAESVRGWGERGRRRML